MTVASASQLPMKSGISTSMLVPGERRRIQRIVAAKIAAPPSGRSSRLTDVMTACVRRICATALATRIGSSASGAASGRPVFTAQKPQARVQVSPRIMKVAVPASQHSPMFGQRASSQTVCRRSSRISDLRRM